MKTQVRTYSTDTFRREYLDRHSKLHALFDKSLDDFFCLTIEDVIPDFKLPVSPSREKCHSIILITEGVYTTTIGFEEFSVNPNDVLVVQAGAVFSVNKVPENVKGYACHFHPDTLIGSFGNLGLIAEFEFLHIGNNPIVTVSDGTLYALQNLFKRLHAEFNNRSEPNTGIIHSYLYALLTELKVVFREESTIKQTAAHHITNQFRKLAYERAREHLKTSDFARTMNISPNHLNKSVKSVTGKSASGIIDEIKLIEIKYLLYQSSLSISEISYNMGYSDPSYFTRFFKNKEGISPSAFRKMIEKSY